MKVEVAVLGSPSLIDRRVSVDVKPVLKLLGEHLLREHSSGYIRRTKANIVGS